MRQIWGGGNHSLINNKSLESYNLNIGTYFIGYFQTLAYFDNIRDILLKDFSLKVPLDSKNQAMKEKILNTKDSVMLHVRRGDYLQYDGFFVTLGSSYYNGALKALQKRAPNAHIFIFSNDIAWCKTKFLGYLDSNITKNFTFEFVENNDEGSAAFELELMRNCKHNIIANSTFSWWAAYLNENPNKVVICPNRFTTFTPDEVYTDYEDRIYLKNWIRIDYAYGEELQKDRI